MVLKMFKLFMSILLIIYFTQANGLPNTTSLIDTKEQVYNDYDFNSNELNFVKSFTSKEDKESDERITNIDSKLFDKNKYFIELLKKLKTAKLFDFDNLIHNDNDNIHVTKEDGLNDIDNVKDEQNSYKEFKLNENKYLDGEIKRPNADEYIIEL
jgi:hypothetical protein